MNHAVIIPVLAENETLLTLLYMPLFSTSLQLVKFELLSELYIASSQSNLFDVLYNIESDLFPYLFLASYCACRQQVKYLFKANIIEVCVWNLHQYHHKHEAFIRFSKIDFFPADKEPGRACQGHL
jgi:hypothetical protein